MTTLFNPSIGSQSFVGFALESTPGTAVAATDYIEIDPDQLSFKYDPKRQNMKTAAGSLVVNRHLVEKNASVSGAIKIPLFTRQGMKLLFACGLLDTKTGSSAPYTHTGTLTKPKSLTIEVNRGGMTQSLQYAGCLGKHVKIEIDSNNGAFLTFEFDGMKKPVWINATTPTFTQDNPYLWSHMNSPKLIGGGVTTYDDVDTIMIEWSFANKMYWGSAQTQLPTRIIPGPVDVKGSFKKLFTTQDEYNSFLQFGQTPGDIQFVLTQGSSASFTMDMPNAFYPTQDFKTPIEGPIVEEYTFDTTAQNGGTLITVTVTNADSTAYTTS